MDELFVLVHSPVVGPVTWQPVAEELRRRGGEVVVPDLTGITSGRPPFWPNAVQAVRADLQHIAADRPVVLVGHSNSGVLLPVIAAGIDQTPAASVFVDAAIPALEGATDLSNDDAFFMLRALADDDGVLPPWDEWFDAEAMAEVMPDVQLRQRISAQLPRLPLSYYQQSIPVPAGWDAHPVSYIQFSTGYGTEADAARQRGWWIRQLPGQHLHQVVDPVGVAGMLRETTGALASRGLIAFLTVLDSCPTLLTVGIRIDKLTHADIKTFLIESDGVPHHHSTGAPRMTRRTRFAAIGAAAAVAVAAASGGYAFASDDTASDPGSQASADLAEMAAAPYLYMGWADPPSPSEVMDATGVSWFTMAFILSDGTCNPAWDSERPLEGGIDAEAIEEIRSAGGDIVPSIGGWSGNKLGPNCSSAEELAGAYQQVIDAYDLKAIDVDIENTDEFENEEVQDRILEALKIVKEDNPDITTILTFGTTTSGPNEWGERLISQAAELEADVDIFTQMPFNFSGSDMYADTVAATEGLRDNLQESFGWDEAEAYSHIGVSGMNGMSDQSEETTTQDWTQLRDWASDNGLARFTFWSVNRDRPCEGDVAEDCSGTEQEPWEFSSITGEF